MGTLHSFARRMDAFSTLHGPLSQSDVVDIFRKDLIADKAFRQSDTHVFIILGASV
ncbi:hypothetical protein chiPu_0031038, partial [Chiloscyllium punctatum]|nr:hypothetical protein [Chiloscyllium punctatum]